MHQSIPLCGWTVIALKIKTNGMNPFFTLGALVKYEIDSEGKLYTSLISIWKVVVAAATKFTLTRSSN